MNGNAQYPRAFEKENHKRLRFALQLQSKSLDDKKDVFFILSGIRILIAKLEQQQAAKFFLFSSNFFGYGRKDDEPALKKTTILLLPPNSTSRI